MIIIDEKRIFEIISQRKPVTVALNAPDGMLPQVQQTAINITKNLIFLHLFWQIQPGEHVI